MQKAHIIESLVKDHMLDGLVGVILSVPDSGLPGTLRHRMPDTQWSVNGPLDNTVDFVVLDVNGEAGTIERAVDAVLQACKPGTWLFGFKLGDDTVDRVLADAGLSPEPVSERFGAWEALV